MNRWMGSAILTSEITEAMSRAYFMEHSTMNRVVYCEECGLAEMTPAATSELTCTYPLLYFTLPYLLTLAVSPILIRPDFFTKYDARQTILAD